MSTWRKSYAAFHFEIFSEELWEIPCEKLNIVGAIILQYLELMFDWIKTGFSVKTGFRRP